MGDEDESISKRFEPPTTSNFIFGRSSVPTVISIVYIGRVSISRADFSVRFVSLKVSSISKRRITRLLVSKFNKRVERPGNTVINRVSRKASKEK